LIIEREVKRILIVEDEFLIAMELEDLLTGMGHRIVGPASRMSEAMEFALGADIDFAVLDINIAGTQSFPVADILRERGIPFVFASGYGSDGLMDGYRHEATLRKPYEPREIRRAIERAFPAGL
jgi:CheY-like chemotaxis protein